MTYSGGQIHWGGSISGNSSVVSVKAIYTLEKQNSNGAYSFVGDWSFSGTNAWLDSSGDKTAPLGTYRLTVAVTATTRTGTVENTSNSLVKTFS
jgi:hypothetical protein